MTIKEICKKYHKKIDYLDLELIIAHILKKTREFILAHLEYKLNKFQISNLIRRGGQISRRMRGEPLAYILGHKEFFGLDFKVNRHTLIPRPETEMLVEEVLKLQPKNSTLIDVGAGSGNIIISLIKNLKTKNKFIATDISAQALKIAKYNAKRHKVDKNIAFLKSDLLKNKKLTDNLTMRQCGNLIIIANLPYLSEKIYNSTARDVKNYEPKSALASGIDGLDHYGKLLQQIKKLKKDCFMFHASCFMEISPEQKPALQKIAGSVLPGAKLEFMKDLAGKWRICKIVI